MAFDEFAREQIDLLADPLAALVALTDLELERLPAEDRAILLALVREHAVHASVIAAELRAHSKACDGQIAVEIDLRQVDAQAPAAA